MIEQWLLEILACPYCKGDVELWEQQQRIVCKKCGRRYPIRDGIPVMLIDEAELPEDTATETTESAEVKE
ncbi:MAG TPA: Trm112 family protein [Armatimonadetes bacterium]|nr:Trm112 family protein [Armatimonadota bacterium]